MESLLEKIVSDNVGLIWKISKQFYGVEKQDLYQAGVLGVIKAFQNYHEDGTTKFSSYAYKYIYGEMYMIASNKNMKIGKDIVKLMKMIEKGKNLLAKKWLSNPSNQELSLFLEKQKEKINQALMCAKSVLSIDEEYEDERNLKEKIAVEEIISEDDKLLLKDCLSSLNDLEKDIITARYYEDLTQSETAKKLGITQVMVSRYESKSLQKMRTYMYM